MNEIFSKKIPCALKYLCCFSVFEPLSGAPTYAVLGLLEIVIGSDSFCVFSVALIGFTFIILSLER